MTGHPDSWTGYQRWGLALLCSLVARPSLLPSIPPLLLSRAEGRGYVERYHSPTWPKGESVRITKAGAEAVARIPSDTRAVLAGDGLALRDGHPHQYAVVEHDGEAVVIAKTLSRSSMMPTGHFSAKLAETMGRFG